MPWAKGTNHVKHIKDLERMLSSSAAREYNIDDAPAGFMVYWEKYFEELFLVGCLMYLETVFGTDLHWQSSTAIRPYPMLKRRLEGMRCVRNCIVHNASKLNPEKSRDANILWQLEKDMKAGSIIEEYSNYKGRVVEPFYSLESDNTIRLLGMHHPRWMTVQYLMIEREMVPN